MRMSEMEIDLRELSLAALVELYRSHPDDVGIGIRLRELFSEGDAAFGELGWAVQEVALAYAFGRPEGADWGPEEATAFLGWDVSAVRDAIAVLRVSDVTLI